MLQSVDSHWREHLSALDHLRQGIHLRGYAQKNPTQEYKREAFELFSLLLDMIKTDVTRTLMTVQIRSAEELRAAEEHEALQNVQYQHASPAEVAESPETGAGQQSEVKCAADERPDDRAPAVQGKNTNSVTAS
jgi:preprotein translocase subunit SecA